QRLQVEFDQLSENQSEVSNQSCGSGNSTTSSGSSNSSLEENRNRFKRVFDSKKEVRDTMDYAFETARREIRKLTGERIGKGSVENFYYGKGDNAIFFIIVIYQILLSIRKIKKNVYYYVQFSLIINYLQIEYNSYKINTESAPMCKC